MVLADAAGLVEARLPVLAGGEQRGELISVAYRPPTVVSTLWQVAAALAPYGLAAGLLIVTAAAFRRHPVSFRT